MYNVIIVKSKIFDHYMLNVKSLIKLVAKFQDFINISIS